jgi:hypothetical protein
MASAPPPRNVVGREQALPSRPEPDPSLVHAVSREALGEAGRLVWDFLELLGQRRFAEANRYLAPGCRMVFPGGVELTDCTALEQRAAIYRRVDKVFERFDEIGTAQGAIVYNFGTLQGEWPDGAPFAGVRYIDRFVVRNGRIIDQRVWNDLCLAAARNK